VEIGEDAFGVSVDDVGTSGEARSGTGSAAPDRPGALDGPAAGEPDDDQTENAGGEENAHGLKLALSKILPQVAALTACSNILPVRLARMLSSVAVILIDDFAPFEFGVLCEVFGIDRTDEGVPPMEFRVCGERAGEPLRSTVGVQVIPEAGLDAVRGADLVAVPAATIRDEYPVAVLDALRSAAADGSTLLSVCSGAFILGAGGLLDGRRCTTHWHYAERFAARFPQARLDPAVLFVDDGNIITSAGTAAGIDACLHLIRREVGSGPATAIARRMVVPPQRDGGQRQYIEHPIPSCAADSLGPVLAWMRDHLAAEHTVAALARRAKMSERTFARRFLAETGTTPNRWLTTQRVLRARQLLEETDLRVEEVAAHCGFGSAALLRHHFQRAVGVAPNDYRRTFGRATHASPAAQ
jgi:AraC family transcriptional regulator, transcriptional activator FtrA